MTLLPFRRLVALLALVAAPLAAAQTFPSQPVRRHPRFSHSGAAQALGRVSSTLRRDSRWVMTERFMSPN